MKTLLVRLRICDHLRSISEWTGTKYQHRVRVLDILQMNKLENISLITNKEK